MVRHALISGASWHCGCQLAKVRKKVNEKKAIKMLNGEYKKKPANLVGQRFGRLVVLEQLTPGFATKSKFRCRCDCGNEVIKSYTVLRAGTQSCGCLDQEKIHDLTGQKFGMLTALEYVAPTDVERIVPENQRKKIKNGNYLGMWKCRCDCGNYRYALSGQLVDGQIKSCGCANKKEDLTGQTFGRLTVLEEVPKGDPFYQKFKRTEDGYWKCQCSCGNIAYASTSSLKRGQQISCGCYASDVSGLVMDVAHTKKILVEGTDIDKIKDIMSGKLFKNNKTGVTGVIKYGDAYRAQIGFQGQKYYLGQYRTLEDATKARKTAEKIFFGDAIDHYEKDLKAEFEKESDEKKGEAMRKLRAYCKHEHEGDSWKRFPRNLSTESPENCIDT